VRKLNSTINAVAEDDGYFVTIRRYWRTLQFVKTQTGKASKFLSIMTRREALDEVPERVSFPEEERKILRLWEEKNAFYTSLELSKGRQTFSFYDGPPFATGLPHYGNILAGTIKDVVTRYAYQV